MNVQTNTYRSITYSFGKVKLKSFIKKIRINNNFFNTFFIYFIIIICTKFLYCKYVLEVKTNYINFLVRMNYI